MATFKKSFVAAITENMCYVANERGVILEPKTLEIGVKLSWRIMVNSFYIGSLVGGSVMGIIALLCAWAW